VVKQQSLTHSSNMLTLRITDECYSRHVPCTLNWKSKFYSQYCREQVNFQWDDDEVCFVLDQHAELDFYGASSLKQQSSGRHVAPLGHIILIPSQPDFALSL
jgi:hypothetical protein